MRACKLWMLHILMLLSLAAQAQPNYSDWSEGQLNQELTDIQSRIDLCEENIENVESWFDLRNFEGTSDERERAINKAMPRWEFLLDQKECLIKERKKLAAIKKELFKRMKDYSPGDRGGLNQLKKKEAELLTRTNALNTRINDMKRELDKHGK